MKKGFTTGSCAAAAAKAATVMLFEGAPVDKISVATPAGVNFTTPVADVMSTNTTAVSLPERFAECAVIKPSSDDPDVTAGMKIIARAQFIGGTSRVVIEGGDGIGTVTKPGLDRPVGDAAINSVPRRMIEDEVSAVADEYGYSGCIKITISAPEGKDIAASTFNPRLGIEGGISIIGTSGVVEPMSTKAIVDTIRIELNQKRQMGFESIVVSPGNYGFDFMKRHYGYDLDKAVKCSNFIGDTIDIAKELGFSQMLLVGHIGKLIKVSGGIMNTHSKVADKRMELMAEAAKAAGADDRTLSEIFACVSTDEAYRIMKNAGIEEAASAYFTDRIAYHLGQRAGDMKIGCIVYSNEFGVLGSTPGAERMLKSQ